MLESPIKGYCGCEEVDCTVFISEFARIIGADGYWIA
jgi:hypothetical protein